MRSSLFFRIFAGYVLLALALSAVTLILSFRAIGHHNERTAAVGLRDLGYSLALEVAPLVETGRRDELNGIARDLGLKTATRITVIDTAGTVLADSDEEPGLMENHRTRPEVMRALEGEVGEARRVSSTLHQAMLYVAVPIEIKGRVGGVVRTSTYIKNISGLVRGLEKSLAGLAVAVVLVSLLAALAFSSSLTRPLDQLGAAARRVGSGDFDARVIIGGTGELRALGDTFNQMTEKIRSLVGDLSRRQEELASIISSIQDGLVVLEADGAITLANDGFRRIVGQDDVEGRPFWEVLRAPEFADLVRKVSRDRPGLSREISIGERIYAANAAAISSRGDVVVLLHDVTDLKDLERVKRDFVANLSHELRTPLTSIRGDLETMEQEAGEAASPHLEVIKRNADRLGFIIEDLMRLSELEDSRTWLDLGEVDVLQLIRDVVPAFDRRLREKQIALEVDAPGAPYIVTADAFKLEQVLVNLIDNAVKCTEKGTIRVLVRKVEGRLVIEVADTGIGIPREHLPRIFERFYVVDKSRSRKVGGTGLGLAIVKHIVLLHNGSIDVKSTPGVGTKFTVSFPSTPA
jgi:two-component system, OmpR family, phosphate regulon sensor histidine kinase PhoR